ncbi:MAG: hypothetical protein OIN83_09710 [Candidatus Methanoperedens sp.]|nr:hypothetical protein [Candidatus Methanoperedens sp.]
MKGIIHNYAVSLKRRLGYLERSQLEGTLPGEQRILYNAQGDGNPFARLEEGDEHINNEKKNRRFKYCMMDLFIISRVVFRKNIGLHPLRIKWCGKI